MNHPLALDQSKSLLTSHSRHRKVLHLINGEHFSGAERVQDLLALSLPALQADVGFVCLKPGKFPTERQSQDSELFSLNMKSRMDFRALRRLSRIVEEYDYELLHAHTPRSLMVGSLIKRKVGLPLVYHVHSPVGRDTNKSLRNRLNQLVETWSARQVDHFVCVSDSLRDYMIGLGHDPAKISTVPNGVAIVPDVPERTTPAGCWTLGTTALFRPRKGTEVLLQALSMLRQQGINVRLLAVGPFESDEYEAKVKSLACELSVEDAVEWTGFTNDVNSQFQRMDAFVLPSLFGEGLPMVILESMALGVPVIAAEVEGIPQAIRDRQDGLLFAPGAADQLGDRIRELIAGQHDWQALRRSALERQRERFSDMSMAKGVARVYAGLLK
ncbi:MAG: glycosyltransferase family 4 protein [Pirellulaceae bacterium]